MMRILFLFALAALTALGSPYSAVKQNDKHCRKKVVRNKVSISKLIRDAKIHNFFNPPQPYTKEDRNLKAIVGGSRASRKDYPWVSLLIIHDKETAYECTGVAINEVLMLTAAHCIPDDEDGSITVLMGFDDKSRARKDSRIVTQVNKRDIYAHNGFKDHNPWEYSPYDIAIFQYDAKPYLRKPIVGYYYYPKLNKEKKTQFVYRQQCTILGFGVVNPNGLKQRFLQKATVYMETHYKDNLFHFTSPFQAACFGDSGGPVVCTVGGQKMLTGIISGSDSNCNASTGSAVIAVKISYHFQWIYRKFLNFFPRGSILNYTGSCHTK